MSNHLGNANKMVSDTPRTDDQIGYAGSTMSAIRIEFARQPLHPLVMRFCYADPPYLGCGQKLYGDRHDKAADWDDPERHRHLVGQLCDEFPHGWAMSLHTPSLRTILPMCPEDCRVAAWVKPFAVFKPNVTVAYAWEPVIFRGGRPRPRTMPTVRDWVSECITLKKGCPGAKPEGFTLWLLDLLNVQPQDEFVDMFPGSGMVAEAYERWKRSPRLPLQYA